MANREYGDPHRHAERNEPGHSDGDCKTTRSRRRVTFESRIGQYAIDSQHDATPHQNQRSPSPPEVPRSVATDVEDLVVPELEDRSPANDRRRSGTPYRRSHSPPRRGQSIFESYNDGTWGRPTGPAKPRRPSIQCNEDDGEDLDNEEETRGESKLRHLLEAEQEKYRALETQIRRCEEVDRQWKEDFAEYNDEYTRLLRSRARAKSDRDAANKNLNSLEREFAKAESRNRNRIAGLEEHSNSNHRYSHEHVRELSDELDVMREETNLFRDERDRALANCQEAIQERDQAMSRWELAIEERDEARRQLNSLQAAAMSGNATSSVVITSMLIPSAPSPRSRTSIHSIERSPIVPSSHREHNGSSPPSPIVHPVAPSNGRNKRRRSEEEEEEQTQGDLPRPVKRPRRAGLRVDNLIDSAYANAAELTTSVDSTRRSARKRKQPDRYQ